METTTATEALLRRDRTVMAVALAIVAALAWSYVMTGAGTGMSMREMTRIAISPGAFAGRGMSMPFEWTGSYWFIMVAMWWDMMIAMMVPGAAPMILLYARTARYAQKGGQIVSGVIPTAAFAGGYLIVWLGFSVLATTLMFSLEQAALMSSMMMWSLDPWLSAGILLAAGVYQITPLKQTCLKHCRSPVQFLSGHWRPGRTGAFLMGMHHGAFCVGCCWALMALLFVGGVMNLLWIAGLAIFVLIEKVVPRGEGLARAGGVACIAGGLWIGLRAAGVA
jgi:predicted metal-binding membrane protein